jgi:hypothetical protein
MWGAIIKLVRIMARQLQYRIFLAPNRMAFLEEGGSFGVPKKALLSWDEIGGAIDLPPVWWTGS